MTYLCAVCFTVQNLFTYARVSIAGEDFTYNEAFKPGGLFSAMAVSVATILGGAAIVIPPLRFLLRKVVPKPGSGESVCSIMNCIWLILAAHLTLTLPGTIVCHLSCRQLLQPDVITVAFSISVYCQMYTCPIAKS